MVWETEEGAAHRDRQARLLAQTALATGVARRAHYMQSNSKNSGGRACHSGQFVLSLALAVCLVVTLAAF